MEAAILKTVRDLCSNAKSKFDFLQNKQQYIFKLPCECALVKNILYCS